MSKWLGRPYHIDYKECSVVFPNLRLDDTPGAPGLPSPFAHMLLQSQLLYKLTDKYDGVTEEMTPEQIEEQLGDIDIWFNSLPPQYRLIDTDTTWDQKYPYLVSQRLQLQIVTQLIRLETFIPYLTKDFYAEATPTEKKFRELGVNTAIDVLVKGKTLYDFEFPNNSEFHLVLFALFKASAVLCAALIHDKDFVLPDRQHIIDTIEQSIDILKQINNKAARMSFSFLAKILQTAPLKLGEYLDPTDRSKRVKKDRSPSSATAFTLGPATIVTNSTDSTLHFPASGVAEPKDWDPLSNSYFQFPTDMNPPDFGGMEDIWDWSSLNIDPTLYEKASENPME
jgi:hypothetical protein